MFNLMGCKCNIFVVYSFSFWGYYIPILQSFSSFVLGIKNENLFEHSGGKLDILGMHLV